MSCAACHSLFYLPDFTSRAYVPVGFRGIGVSPIFSESLGIHVTNSAAIRPIMEARTSGNLIFFGAAPGSAPWFQPERLSEPDFSVDAYVSDLRQHAPLEALSLELEKYLASLKSKVA